MITAAAEPTPEFKSDLKKRTVQKEDLNEQASSSELTEESTNQIGIWQYTPFRQLEFFYVMFFSRKFIVHRLTGLTYLLQYVYGGFLYFYDYQAFYNSPLVFTLPFTGVIQSTTAIYTFTFLPKKTKDQGYFSDKYTMNYPFIVENSFFALILMYQFLYYHDFWGGLMAKSIVIETVFTFFPYVIRQYWPKTSFRDSLESDKGRTPANRFFFRIGIQITKTFYIWAKHYIGYFLNYVRFMDRSDERVTKHIYLMLISGAFATTIAVFLHTLKFRKHIGPRVSFVIYFLSYMSTFYSYFFIFDLFVDNLDLFILTFIGLVINFGNRYLQVAWQVIICGLLMGARYGALPEVIKTVLPLPTGPSSWALK